MFSNYRYLYVEDDSLSREIMTMIMENAMGIAALTIFSDSSDFMQRITALDSRPDVVMLDIQVTPHDGFEMLRMLRENPAYDDVRVVALTASVMNEEVTRLQDSGFDGAIAKPLSVQTFPQIMQRILEGETVWHIV
jgi:two-component system, cell cycle response regulator DivK